MKTIRRLYFYAIAFISIEVVAWGMINLLRSIFDANEISNTAFTLAQALALILVGVPIFLVHWVWAQRTSAADEEENSASLRAIFLYGILLATLIPAVQNLLALFNRTFLSTVHLYAERAIVGGSQTWTDNLIAIVINALLAGYFWNILQINWLTLDDTESFAEVRRLARFIWVLYGMLMTVYGVQQALDYVFTLSSSVLGEIGKTTVVNAIALIVIGTPIWYFSWRLLQNALSDSAEKESYLRLGILYLLTLGGVIVSLSAGGSLLYMILLRLLGDASPWSDFMREIGGPISMGVPFLAIWAYYGEWLSRQFAFDEDLPRRASKQRLFYYILSFLGLAATVTGIISLFSVLVDLALGKYYLSEGGFRGPLSGAFAALAVGLPIWLKTWRPMQEQALAKDAMGDHARRSIIRKSYLYLVLFASVLGGMGSAGALVFNLVNAALGGGTFNLLSNALNEILALAVFVVVLVYHLASLRKDGVSSENVLVEKQSQFRVLVFDSNGTFGDAIQAAFDKRASNVPITVLPMDADIPSDINANAVILPGSFAANMPEKITAWMKSFTGSKLFVGDEAAGVFWVNDFGQAADSAKAWAEGQEIRPQSAQRATSVWTYVAYVFAGLFACQLLFMLLLFGISLVSGF